MKKIKDQVYEIKFKKIDLPAANPTTFET